MDNIVIEIFAVLVVSFVCGLITRAICINKGRNSGFLWGALLGIIGIIIVACFTNENKIRSNNITDLKNLGDLYEKGLISKSEFDQKKS